MSGTGGFSGAARRARVAGPFARAAVGQMVAATAGEFVVDIAAGTGILTGVLHRAGRVVVAVEVDLNNAAHIRRAVSGLVVNAAPHALPFRDGAFGVAVSGMAEANAEAPDPQRWWGEAHRVLAPGGDVMVMVSDPSAIGRSIVPPSGTDISTLAHEQVAPDGSTPLTTVLRWSGAA